MKVQNYAIVFLVILTTMLNVCNLIYEAKTTAYDQCINLILSNSLKLITQLRLFSDSGNHIDLSSKRTRFSPI
jgi:hypothetical protein